MYFLLRNITFDVWVKNGFGKPEYEVINSYGVPIGILLLALIVCFIPIINILAFIIFLVWYVVKLLDNSLPENSYESKTIMKYNKNKLTHRIISKIRILLSKEI